MKAVIGLGPYAGVLLPQLADISRIARGNHQVQRALQRVAVRAEFVHTGRLRRADLGADLPTLAAFLEHIRFASPDFLASVGEWPVGGNRDS